MNIVLHQAHTPRFLNSGTNGERQMIEKVVSMLKPRLEEVGFDVRVYNGIELPKVSTDLFLAPHCNGATPSAKGFIVERPFFQFNRPTRELSQKFKDILIDEYAKATSIRHRPDSTKAMKYYYAFKQVTGPACIIEMGFMTNPEERKFMEENTEFLVQGIFNGIMRFFQINPIANDPEKIPDEQFIESWNAGIKAGILSEHSRPRAKTPKQEVMEMIYRGNKHLLRELKDIVKELTK